jgi:hypothetical protein
MSFDNYLGCPLYGNSATCKAEVSACCIGVEAQNWTHGSKSCIGFIYFSGPTVQPTCHPVHENVFPQLDNVIVRSYMSGSLAK